MESQIRLSSFFFKYLIDILRHTMQFASANIKDVCAFNQRSCYNFYLEFYRGLIMAVPVHMV
ncbi:hypothetical protein P5673_030813 [Acropora cervicornis]|uniref:Uncharacterized protein n=1 Tax=Acropora cervicornis TaxID=6130 RepID=A0AAD9PU10_ACRCE|nr:hypothetical protein P5673_030813 [Acropora cervicornis]